jgi:hypothetical protein
LFYSASNLAVPPLRCVGEGAGTTGGKTSFLEIPSSTLSKVAKTNKISPHEENGFQNLHINHVYYKFLFYYNLKMSLDKRNLMFYQFFCSYSYWKITDSVTKNSNTSFSS